METKPSFHICLQQGTTRDMLWKSQCISIFWGIFGKSRRYEKSNLGWPSLNGRRKKRIKMCLWTLQYWGQTDRVKNTLRWLLCFQLQTKWSRFTLPVSGVWNELCLTTTPPGSAFEEGLGPLPSPSKARAVTPHFFGGNLGAFFQTSVKVSRAAALLLPHHPTGADGLREPSYFPR